MSFSQKLKENSLDLWEACYSHPFLQRLKSGNLDKSAFQFYLIQDYIYLLDYAKVFALGAYKAETEEMMTNFTQVQNSILTKELDIHRSYMRSFGIEPKNIKDYKQSLYNRAYTANMIAVAQSYGAEEIIAVILPCAWTYCDLAKRLKEEIGTDIENNFYRSWIETYAGDEFRDSFTWMLETLDKWALQKSFEELTHLEEIFRTSVEFEYMFWDMAYKKQMSF